MTREEAITILKAIRVYEWYPKSAIEALSEPNMIPIKLEKRYPESRDEDIIDAFMQGYLKGKADRPQGEWIAHATAVDDKEYIEYGRCSECGELAFVRMNYCPNCGADMRGKDNG